MKDEVYNVYKKLVSDRLLGMKEELKLSCNAVTVTRKDSEKFFDRVEVPFGSDRIKVYKYGLHEPWYGFCFDYSVDYAKLLFYFEEDIYLIGHGAEPKHFRFVDESGEDIRYGGVLISLEEAKELDGRE